MSGDLPENQSMPLGAGSGVQNPVPGPVMCGACGYNLAGLGQVVACPECGRIVDTAQADDRLRFCSLEYVNGLCRGARIVEISWLCKIAIMIIGVLAVIVFGIANLNRMGLRMPIWGDTVRAGLEFAITVGSLFGWWLLTAPSPTEEASAKLIRARVILRWTLIILTCASTLELVATLIPSLKPHLSISFNLSSFTAGGTLQMGAIVAASLKVLLALAALASFFATLQHLRVLSLRTANQQLAKKIDSFFWIIPLMYIFGRCIVIGPTIAGGMMVWVVWQLRKSIEEERRQLLLMSSVHAGATYGGALSPPPPTTPPLGN